ncbi:hypothetical protein [Kitasatospora sp. NPDC002040]|uniref:hypothetical protein n=1 Tax=Kitasatospora sp. NPDC002040 TaxID=3154661 RepID=UPI0033167792
MYVILPAGISAEAQLAVLDVLATADRFGQDRTGSTQGVWAEIDHEQKAAP